MNTTNIVEPSHRPHATEKKTNRDYLAFFLSAILVIAGSVLFAMPDYTKLGAAIIGIAVFTFLLRHRRPFGKQKQDSSRHDF